MNKLFFALLLISFCMFIVQNATPAYTYYPAVPDKYYTDKPEACLQIAKIEYALFGKTFDNSNIYSRLDRIERKLFKTTNSKANLPERLATIFNSIDPVVLANASKRNMYQKTALKNMFRNIVSTTSDITGITPPVYNPEPYNFYYNNDYNRFYRNRFYNNMNNFNSSGLVHILD